MDFLAEYDIKKLESIISKAGRITLLTHSKPDGDAIGSTTGLMHYLSGRGKDVMIVIPNAAQGILGFIMDTARTINAGEDPQAAAERIASSDTLFCLDFNTSSRIDSVEPLLLASKAVKVLIDHHLHPQSELYDLVFSKPDISSTCELVFNILKAMGDVAGDASRLGNECLTPLMTGMTTDTNNFANSVYPSTLEMASELLAAGVDRDDILFHLYNEYPERRLRALGYLLSRKMTITPDGVAYMILEAWELEQFGLLDGETEGFVNQPLAIDKVKASIFLKEDDGKFRVSIRSKRGFSAYRLAAAHFNGGGHEMASGGKLVIGVDIPDKASAASYIEQVTARFVQQEQKLEK